MYEIKVPLDIDYATCVPQDIPESPFTPHQGADLSSGAIGHNPTPVMSAVAHSRLSLATPPHSPFKQYTSSPAMRSHMHSPVPIRLMSPALGQISTSQSRSPFLGEYNNLLTTILFHNG